ncbi:DUF5316 family protein [Desulfosporosinus sp. SYSU MS00001]|uniref:DUF5316 family protein n=1 Tax=Desulfosporosinus sp. SYSU MS00001 TaxID=3416284 RepID=UPI003CF9315B
MLSLGLGALTIILVYLVSFVLGDWALIKVFWIIGLVTLGISALLSGVFISGNKVRANWKYEDNEDKSIRQGWANRIDFT